MNNEEEHKQQQQQGHPDPATELFLRGHHVFMAEVTQETMKPLIDWIISENFNREKKKKEKIQTSEAVEYIILIL